MGFTFRTVALSVTVVTTSPLSWAAEDGFNPDAYPLDQRFAREFRRNIFDAGEADKAPPEMVWGLRFHNSGLTEIPKDLGRFKKLRYLSFKGNDLKLSANDLSGLAALPQLQHLFFREHGIESIASEISLLAPLTNLASFSVISRGLTSVSSNIYKLHSLEELTLANCRIASLPDGIASLTNLANLVLSFNPLKALPADLGKSRIKQIDLLKCDLVDSAVGALPATLEGFDASGNRLSRIPEGVFAAGKLKGLFLHGNQIAEIPEQLTQLKDLQRLGLSQNKIKTLPKEILQLKHLEWLELLNNPVEDLPPELLPLVQNGVILLK